MPHKNKKVLELFKDEYLKIPICEWVGCRSKMYAFSNNIQKKNVHKEIKYRKNEV